MAENERWKFKDWLKNLTAAWSGAGPKTIVPAGSPDRYAFGGQNKPVTLAAMKKVAKNRVTGDMVSRQEEARRKNSIYRHDIEPIVRDKLKQMFHPDNYERMRIAPSTWTNTMRRIVDDISILYQKPATRYLQEETPEPIKSNLEEGDPLTELADILNLAEAPDKEEGAFDRLLKAADLDTTLDTVEKMVRIHEAVWVRPFVSYEGKLINPDDGTESGDPATAKLSYIVYTPEEADVVEDPSNPNEALAWYYFGEELNEKGEKERVIHFFTSDSYTKFDKEWKVLKTENNELGRLPVVVFRKELPSMNSYYCQGVGRDLLAATVEFNVLRTIQNVRFRDSGFKQLALVNVDDERVPADQVLGGPTPIYIPEGGSANVLDMMPHLDQMMNDIKARVIELATSYGISANDFKAEGTPASGFAKRLDRDRVLTENMRIRKFFAEGERELYKLTCGVLGVYRVEGLEGLNAEAEYVVDYSEPTFSDDPATENSNDAKAIALGKTNIIEILQRANPDLTELQLARLAIRNRRINEFFAKNVPNSMRLMDLLAGVNDAEKPEPNEPEVDDAETEES